MSISIKDWVTPSALGEAAFHVENCDESVSLVEPVITREIDEDIKDSPEDSGGGLDPKILLGLLGDSNPGLSSVMGLLNGDKPDIMSLLPLLMQLGKKEEKPPAEPAVKSVSLDDYTIIS